MVATARVTWWLLGSRGQFLHQAGDTGHGCVIQRWVCKGSCCHPPIRPRSLTRVIQLSCGREDITQPWLGWASTSAGVKTRVMTARVCGWWDLNTPNYCGYRLLWEHLTLLQTLGTRQWVAMSHKMAAQLLPCPAWLSGGAGISLGVARLPHGLQSPSPLVVVLSLLTGES